MLRLGKHSAAGQGIASWPVLLCLALGVLTPSASLLWFMNRAVQNEQFAVRQKYVEVYQTAIQLISLGVPNFWQSRIDAAERLLKNRAPCEQFEAILKESLAEGVVLKGQYPNALKAIGQEPRVPGWHLTTDGPGFMDLAARATNLQHRALALQAAARLFRSAGKTYEALKVLVELAGPDFEQATDSQGRLLAPSADLAVLELLPEADERFQAARARLRKRVGYQNVGMSSAQRRFLSAELANLTGDQAELLPAEQLSAAVAPSIDWQASGVQILSNGGVVAFVTNNLALLYGSATLARALERALVLSNSPGDFRVFAGPAPAEFLASCSLPDLPGWHLAVRPKNPDELEEMAQQRIAVYLWAGLLALGAATIVSLIAARVLVRQNRLARLKNDLLANVTHELKTPLASTRLLVETLLASPKLEEGTAREYLELICRENRRLGGLIENFLAFSRMERNKYSFDFRTVSAAEIGSQAADALREQFLAAGVDFQTDFATDLPLIKADADSLITALVNLLDNACKYSGESKKIVMRIRSVDGMVRFEVQDNGMGIPSREKRRIFRRFYQIDRSLSRKSGGCGLGLSIVEFIVRAHGGEVLVDSAVGIGSTFTITVPEVSQVMAQSRAEALRA